ncbi:MAG: putative DNA modification/repair radical SAM protein, partial [Clostridiales bacterium]|nr:putative DNA modification/repair radical SAM protein [Clostridiales bacterium]
VRARKNGNLSFEDLKKIGVILKRALYFITCNYRMMYQTKIEEDYIIRNLLTVKEKLPLQIGDLSYSQLSLFDDSNYNGNTKQIQLFQELKAGVM